MSYPRCHVGFLVSEFRSFRQSSPVYHT